MEFDHAGIATLDADGAVDRFGPLLDASVAHEETLNDLRIVFLALENGYFELLEPQEEGTIARYLENHGAGLHHVALETDDIEAAIGNAEDAGVDLIDEEPRRGAWEHQVAFLHPKSTGGVLIEFVEH